VFYQYNLWKLTLWDKIDTDDLEFQNKELGVQIRNLSKPIKSWKSFGALNKKTEDMKIILPLISQLHSKNMKERHWIKLGQRINQKINFQSAGFKFDDIIALKLQNYQEIVEETVELANKEAKVETKLAKIESYWENAKLIFTLFKRTEGEEGTQLLDYVGLGDIIETLEGHQMDVMGMITGGKVEFFMETLEKWQSTLKCVDDVLSVWIKVQKNWQRLEPIFLKSEDIRSQLPDDTKRFEELDKTFKDILEASFDQPSVIESCLMEGRLDSLKQNHEIIETCEKSLNDYLEQKKKAFPRFYFVSNQTLLDILSNGTNPHKVAENIKDCFDGLNTIRFIEKQGKLTFSADQFISKEGEIVKMFKNFDAVGAVETWLSNLEKHMRETFRDHLEVSKIASDNWEVDKPRHVWLQD
jgi:dynein heavy chain